MDDAFADANGEPLPQHANPYRGADPGFRRTGRTGSSFWRHVRQAATGVTVLGRVDVPASVKRRVLVSRPFDAAIVKQRRLPEFFFAVRVAANHNKHDRCIFVNCVITMPKTTPLLDGMDFGGESSCQSRVRVLGRTLDCVVYKGKSNMITGAGSADVVSINLAVVWSWRVHASFSGTIGGGGGPSLSLSLCGTPGVTLNNETAEVSFEDLGIAADSGIDTAQAAAYENAVSALAALWHLKEQARSDGLYGILNSDMQSLAVGRGGKLRDFFGSEDADGVWKPPKERVQLPICAIFKVFVHLLKELSNPRWHRSGTGAVSVHGGAFFLRIPGTDIMLSFCFGTLESVSLSPDAKLLVAAYLGLDLVAFELKNIVTHMDFVMERLLSAAQVATDHSEHQGAVPVESLKASIKKIFDDEAKHFQAGLQFIYFVDAGCNKHYESRGQSDTAGQSDTGRQSDTESESFPIRDGRRDPSFGDNSTGFRDIELKVQLLQQRTSSCKQFASLMRSLVTLPADGAYTVEHLFPLAANLPYNAFLYFLHDETPAEILKSLGLCREGALAQSDPNRMDPSRGLTPTKAPQPTGTGAAASPILPGALRIPALPRGLEKAPVDLMRYMELLHIKGALQFHLLPAKFEKSTSFFAVMASYVPKLHTVEFKRYQYCTQQLTLADPSKEGSCASCVCTCAVYSLGGALTPECAHQKYLLHLHARGALELRYSQPGDPPAPPEEGKQRDEDAEVDSRAFPDILSTFCQLRSGDRFTTTMVMQAESKWPCIVTATATEKPTDPGQRASPAIPEVSDDDEGDSEVLRDGREVHWNWRCSQCNRGPRHKKNRKSKVDHQNIGRCPVIAACLSAYQQDCGPDSKNAPAAIAALKFSIANTASVRKTFGTQRTAFCRFDVDADRWRLQNDPLYAAPSPDLRIPIVPQPDSAVFSERSSRLRSALSLRCAISPHLTSPPRDSPRRRCTK